MELQGAGTLSSRSSKEQVLQGIRYERNMTLAIRKNAWEELNPGGNEEDMRGAVTTAT